LRRLGWTQAEMGEALELSRNRVSELLSEIPESVKPTKTQLAKAHQIEEVAEAYNMPLILATALDLDRVPHALARGRSAPWPAFCPVPEAILDGLGASQTGCQ